MTKKVVRIQSNNDTAVLSKNQKRFNNYIKKISNLREGIQVNKQLLELAENLINTKLIPKEKEENRVRSKILQCIDQWLDNGKFSKKTRAILEEYLEEESFSLIQLGFEELIPIYDKYAEDTYEATVKEINEESSQMVKEMFGTMGFDFGDDFDINDPARIVAQMQEQMDAKEMEAFEAERTRKKTKKQQEREAKKLAAENELSQSIKEIYKKLVKEFHPDREKDETEKVRKTNIMAEITQAYEKNDLLSLLQLQLDYEQISEDNVASLSEEKLILYNKILKEQVDALSWELQLISGSNDPSHPFRRLGVAIPSEKSIKSAIKKEEKRQKELFDYVQTELRLLKSDIKEVKRFAKDLEKSAEFDDFDMDDLMTFLQSNQ